METGLKVRSADADRPRKRGSMDREFCDCGNPATVKKNNSKICNRCNEIETAMRRKMK